MFGGAKKTREPARTHTHAHMPVCECTYAAVAKLARAANTQDLQTQHSPGSAYCMVANALAPHHSTVAPIGPHATLAE